MKLGLALPHYDFSFPDGQPTSVERAVSYARLAEQAGFDSLWVSDHLFFDLGKYGGPSRRYETLEAMSLLAVLAAQTTRASLGSLVLAAPFRNPVVLAQQARTIQDASGGRLELGIGAGWYEPEFDEAGIAFASDGERIDALARTASVLRERAPAPVWIGGKGGPRLMRVVAAAADGWNVVWRIGVAEYATRLETLRRACERIGRDPREVRLSVGLTCLLGSDEDDLARRYEQTRRWAPGGMLDGVTLERYAAGALVGTPEDCAMRIKELEALGVEQVIVTLAPLPFAVADDSQLELVATDLAPRVR